MVASSHVDSVLSAVLQYSSPQSASGLGLRRYQRRYVPNLCFSSLMPHVAHVIIDVLYSDRKDAPMLRSPTVVRYESYLTLLLPRSESHPPLSFSAPYLSLALKDIISQSHENGLIQSR